MHKVNSHGRTVLLDVALFDEKKLNEYKEEIMREYDYYLRLAYADQKGRELGRAEGHAETAMNLRAIGMSFEFILHATGLTEDELKKILS